MYSYNSQISVYIEIGKIIMAHQKAIDIKYHKNLFLRESGHNLEYLRKLVDSAAHYEIDSAYKEYQDGKIVEPAVRVMTYVSNRFFKHFKKLKETFLSKYPEYSEILNEELQKSEKEFQQYITQKENSPVERQKFLDFINAHK